MGVTFQVAFLDQKADEVVKERNQERIRYVCDGSYTCAIRTAIIIT